MRPRLSKSFVFLLTGFFVTSWLVIASTTCSALPGKPSFQIIQGHEPYYAGDTIIIRMTSDASNWPGGIAKFNIAVAQTSYEGGPTNAIIVDTSIPAQYLGNQLYSADYSFTFPEYDKSSYDFMASAADSQNVNSGDSELWFTAYASGSGPSPDPTSGSGSLTGGWWEMLVLAVVAATVLVVIITLFFRSRKSSRPSDIGGQGRLQELQVVTQMTDSVAAGDGQSYPQQVRTITAQDQMQSSPNIPMPEPNRPNPNAGFCKYCGKSISSNSAFCKYCGKELN